MRFIIFIFFTGLTVVSCSKKIYHVTNLNENNKIIMLGHGGMGVSSLLPMNTVEAITKCLALGMDGVEIDVQMTKDSILIAFHDPEISLRKFKKIRFKVISLTWDEICGTLYTKYPYKKFKVVRLQDIFDSIEQPYLYYISFDCKLFPPQDNVPGYFLTFAKILTQFIEEKKIVENAMIESTNETFLNIVKKLNPAIRLWYRPKSIDDGLEKALKNGYYGILVANKDISDEQIKIFHQNNIKVTVFNIQSKRQNINAIKKNPDYIQTDRVRSLIRLLNQTPKFSKSLGFEKE